jgi:hypothetical protein
MPLPFLVSAIINVAISIGLSYVSKQLQKKAQEKARKKAEKDRAARSGSILDLQYGEGQPRVVAIGKVVMAGQAVYDNTFGTANKTLQRVLKLSDFRCSALTRIAIDGAWVTTGTLDATKGLPVNSGDYSGLIWVKFLDGSQTSADTYLTGNDNPDGRWTTNHIGNGCAYVIVTCEYNDEKLSSIPEMLFEVNGAPLYDPRKDTTVGGSGSHRWNNVTTWEFSENPILAEYCYRMGFYTGTYGSGHDVFCGMGMAQSELDYTRYAAAADICDQVVSSEARYRVSTFLEADNEHGDNIEELMLACAGMIVEGVTGPFPILGATQSSVATLTNDDLIADAPVEFRLHRPVSEVVNTVSGVYSEPNFVYAETGYSRQQLAAALTADRRTIDYNLNLPMVPSKRQAEQLASIYLSENRFEATKTIVVHPKWLVLEVGDWITWTNDEDGAASRIYQIVGMTILALDSETPRAVQLQLQERDEDIYAGIGAVSAPTAATRPGTPTYLQELQSFGVTAIAVTNDPSGYIAPAISVSWAAVTDPTVEAILIEWRPTGDDTRKVAKVVSRSATLAVLLEGIVGSTEYQVRNTIIPNPVRVTTPSAWSTVTTGSFNIPASVDAASITAAVGATLTRLRDDLTKVLETSNQTALGLSETMISKIEEVLARRVLKAQVGDVSATLAAEQLARVEGDTATALSLVAVEAKADQATAEGLYKIEATAAPGGVTARFGTFLRATTGDVFTTQAAEYLEIVGGQSRKVIAADRTIIADSGGNLLSLFDVNGQFINNARIVNLTADNIAAGAITADRIAAGAITADRIATNTLILGDLNLSKGGFTYSRIVRNSGDTASCTMQDLNSLNHDWFLVHLRVNISDPISGAEQQWVIRIYWPGGSADLEFFNGINGATRNFFFTLFIDRQQYSNLGGGAATIQVERTGPSAGGTRNNASWLIISGVSQG